MPANPPKAPPAEPRRGPPESLHLLIACLAGQLVLAVVALVVVGAAAMPDKGIVEAWIGAPALLSLGVLLEILWKGQAPREIWWYPALFGYAIQILFNTLITLPVGLLVPGGAAYLPLLVMEVLLGGLTLYRLIRNRPPDRPRPRPKPVEPEDIETTGDWDEARDSASRQKQR